MATPPGLVQLRCPTCHADHWEIDHDYRSWNDPTTYFEREYTCPVCGTQRRGFRTREMSPENLFLQPTMMPQEFEKWVALVREHFPDHPLLARLGIDWFARHPDAANGSGSGSQARLVTRRRGLWAGLSASSSSAQWWSPLRRSTTAWIVAAGS